MVALFLRPDADISDGGWTDEGGATTLFDAVDESSFSDTDYIKSTVATGDKVSLRLSDPTGTPTEPMTIRVRCKREGTDATDLISRLYEATSPPTLICYFEIPTVTDAFVTYEHELPAAEFAAIGDFNNLYIEFESNPTLSHHGSQIDLNFQTANYYNSTTPTINGTVTDYLSCSRASIGYAKTSSGTLTQFTSNELRITNLGLLVEDSRTNTILDSQDFNSANWSHFGGTVTVDQIAAPDGTTTADKLIEDSSNGRHIPAYTLQALSNGITYSYSIYVKDGDRRYVGISIQSSTPSLSAIIFDCQAGVITKTDGNLYVSSSVEALANNWFRICMVFTMDAGITHQPYVFLSDSATPTINQGSVSYQGDGAKYIYAWGAQLEVGTFPSSYIPTTTTSATRAADVVTNIGTLSTNIAAATGSIIAQIDGGKVSSVAVNIVDSNGTNLLGFDVTNHGLASISATLATANTANRTTQDKLGLAWNASGRSLVLNGGTVATDATAQTPNSTQHLGSSGSANFAYAYIERLTIWTSKLTDATLQTLTAP